MRNVRTQATAVWLALPRGVCTNKLLAGLPPETLGANPYTPFRAEGRMDHEPARPNEFACAFPSCHIGHGRIQSVTAHDGQRTIGYACSQCQHTWEQTVDAKPGLFATQPTYP